MLSAVRVCTGDGIQRGVIAARVAQTFVHRRIVFKDLCDDRLASRLCAGQRRMDEGDAEGAGSLDQQCDVDFASSRGRSVEWPTGVSGNNAGGIRATT